MSKRYMPVAVVVAMLLGLLLWRPWSAPEPGVSPASDRVAPQKLAGTPGNPEGAPKTRKVVEEKKTVSTQERERYRDAIRDALSRRPAPRTSESGRPSNRDAHDDEAEQPPSGGLKDRSGGKLAGLSKDLQNDVMPLADECYALAREREPALEGSLDLQFEIIGDEDIGGLVESVDLIESSDIQDAEMIECMRETLLSTIFPAPDDSGATGVQLSLRFSPEE